ncbi:MAG TPA: LysE family transporter [Bacteroidia bacterium]|jgi:threonine/homoserine/homoserine lactone efflux protein|nr:LysE family transporter [Bacteroidia bacterium]
MNLVFEAIYKGLALGMALCLGVGPSFFALIQTSLNNGVRSGIALALGIFISDLACVVFAYLGVSQFFMNPEHKTIIGLVGGTILVVFGLYIFLQKKPRTHFDDKELNLKTPNLALTLIKGFFLNILNPVVILLWVTWLGVVSSTRNFTRIHILIFFGTTLLTVVSTDILKVLTADRIKKFINPHVLLWINRLVGTILVTIGAWKLIALLLDHYGH